jgi:16S rRNA (uracil1498-N3)-methyltransferase
MAIHRIFSAEPLQVGNLAIWGEEAHHAARVKRLVANDAVELLDGRGTVARARIVEISKPRGQWQLNLSIEQVRQTPPLMPRLEVCCPAPKGPRLGDLIEGLSQVGAACWAPLVTIRGVTDPRPGKLERLERTAIEAAKQCGRAWILEMGAAMSLKQALDAGDRGRVIVAEAGSARYQPAAGASGGGGMVRVLVGPEGGWTDEELSLARACGAKACSFGPHIMRIETAAVVAAAVIIHAESGETAQR